ncbi:MAG: FG-GAP repeat protein [Phycisphaerae bacterium]|nr:FG-GAP repeat protein [Phycisphaerae bacterium]
MQRHDFARFALGLSVLLCVSLPASADSIRIAPPPGAEGFGGEVRGIADVNGDGAGDILAAALYDVHAGPAYGAVYVLSGATGEVIRMHVPQGFVTHYYGTALVDVPDLDDDGVNDYCIGDPWRDVGRDEGAGGFEIYSGASGALIHSRQSPVPHQGAHFGRSLAVVPDFVSPGHHALIVGEPGAVPAFASRVHIYSLDTFELLATYIDPAGPAANNFGMSVAGFPDADGDGRGDFAVGAPSASFLGLQHVGRLHVYTGGTLVNSIYPLNIAEGVFFAHSLAGCSDMTGDGRGDIIVGSPDESPNGVLSAGCVYIVSGASASVATFATEEPPQAMGLLGFDVAALPDRDGDGRPEWLAGASGRDDSVNPPMGRIRSNAWPHRVDGPADALDFRFGRVVASVPDLNGDGHADLVTGNEWDWESADSGAVYIVRTLRNDACTSLVEASTQVFQGITPITTVGATPTPNLEINPSACMSVAVSDVWFRHEAQCNGTLTVETCGANGFDSMIAIYEGCIANPESCSLGAELACNDDACETGSRVDFAVTAGACHVIRVATYPDTPPGPALLSITCASNCPFDLNADGSVNAADLAILLGVWGTDKPEADFDQSGLIDAADLAQLLGAWSSCGA